MPSGERPVEDPAVDAPAEDDRDATSSSYAAVVDELEAILAELEDDAVDVDLLVARVRRAAELIRWCRSRITGARLEVEQVVADLAGTEGDVADGG